MIIAAAEAGARKDGGLRFGGVIEIAADGVDVFG